MKKLLSFFMAFMIIILTAFCVPFTAGAAEEKSTKGRYPVTETIYADAYMLINLDDASLPVIASKNAEKKKFPASLTKIVTAIVTLNQVSDLSSKTKISKTAIESLYGTGAQVAGLKIGDEITIEQLLYLTMVHSACDACQVLAEYVAGSADEFVKMMNDWVKSIGCENTHFVNPDGLPDDNHYSTVADLALITLEALKNETFDKISCTESYEYNGTRFIHTNFMMDKFHKSYYYEYAKGIKTGSTTAAGYCLITKASKDGYNYLAVVMDSPIKKLDGYDTKCSFIDAATLFDWAFDSLKYSTVVRMNDVVSEVPVNDGKDVDSLQLVAKQDVTTLVPASLDPSTVIIEPIHQPESLDAPIAQGDEICKADIIYGDQVIGQVDLVAAQTVELSTFLKILNALKAFFTNKIVIAVILIIIFCAVVYAVVFANKVRKEKKRISEKRRRQQELDDRLNAYGNDDYLPPPRSGR